MTTLQQNPSRIIPPLQNGDRLTRDEFERRYEKMPHGLRAELIEGMVYVTMKPVNDLFHGGQHFDVIVWLGTYAVTVPGLKGSDNSTLRLDLINENQPDAFLRIPFEAGGQSKRDADGYIEGAPELIVEVAASTASYDLGPKLTAYRRNGVREYVVVRTYDMEIDWFVLRGGQYERLALGADGVYRSEIFPGLWLDAAAMLRGDLSAVLGALKAGTASAEHALFVKRLSR